MHIFTEVHNTCLTEYQIKLNFYHFRPSDPSDGAANRDALIRGGLSDLMFNCAISYFSDKVSGKAPNAYLYHLTYQAKYSVFPQWTGAAHGSDIPVTFITLSFHMHII